LCTLFTDGDWIESKDQSSFGIRLLQTGNVGIDEYIDKENKAKWISEDTFKRLSCEEVFPGDILISRLPDPAGRACIIPVLSTKIITAVDCTIVRIDNRICSSRYIVQYFSTERYFNEVTNLLGGGTRQRVTRSALSRFQIPCSSIAEEKKIGDFLALVDSSIVLHQRLLFY
jgi:type I restriction enzyme S subunit